MGARLQRFAGVIRQLFPRDSWLQRLAQEGLSLGVRPGRVSAGRPLEPHGSPEVLSAIRQEVVALWQKRAIERVPVNELDKPAVYSRLIVVPKAGGKLRPCLNLRRLNQFVPNETFKMEGMNTVQQLIRPNCWMASLDIRDAYLHVAIHRNSVDLLRFVCDGQHWRCRAMIFGASVAPRIFTRLMKTLIAPLRDEGMLLVSYIDDCLLLAESEAECRQAFWRLSRWLESFGLLINYEKSEPTPTHRIKYLGFVIDSRAMTFTLPNEKLIKLRQVSAAVLNPRSPPTRRQLASLAGLIVSTQRAVPMMRYFREGSFNTCVRRPTTALRGTRPSSSTRRRGRTPHGGACSRITGTDLALSRASQP